MHGQFIDRVLDISVAHREVPTVQTVQKTVLGVDPLLRRQVQFLVFWEVVDMPVYVQRQVLSFQQNSTFST